MVINILSVHHFDDTCYQRAPVRCGSQDVTMKCIMKKWFFVTVCVSELSVF